MTLQQQWGSVGMALALTTIVGVCGAGVAQTAISTTPPHVCDLASPAPRAQVARDFTAGTIGQTADFITRDAATNRQIDFNLTSGLLEYTLDGATFGSVPTGLTLTGVTLYDFTALGSANLGRANLPTILLYGDQGSQFLGTANYASTGEPVKVRQADGTEVEMTPVTYTFTDPIAADTGDYRLVLNAVLPPTLPLFSNSLVDGSVMYGTEGSVAPYITFLGKTSPTVYTHTLAGNESLSSIWEKSGLSDSANCHLIVQVDADQTLTLDQTLENATLIIEARGAGASDPTQQHAAPAVVFAESARMTGPFVFRNASGVTNGMISVSGPWQDSDKNDNDQLWEPDSLAIDCDLAFTSPLPLRPRGWFQENDVRVRAGRTLRLESKAANEARLPSVDLTAPSATLTLADTDQTGTIPSKYAEYFFTETSGTLVFAREVALALTSTSSSAEQDSQGAIYRIGNKGDKAYNFNLAIDGHNFSTRDRIRLGGPSGQTTLEIRQTTMTPAPTVAFQDLQFVGNATLLQRLGTLTLGSSDWPTKFVVGEGDSTLLIGDGEGTSGNATANIYGIPYGESGSDALRTDYRGAGDILVDADGVLNLHPTADTLKGTDYHLYPAEHRSLTLRNGGVLNAIGGAVTVAFESPDTLAAPLAAIVVPGLSVENAAALSADPGASLAIDSLKGTGTVTIGGTVTIDTVKSLAGTTLTLDGDPARAGYGELSGTIGAVSGEGSVLFGDLGVDSATATDTVQRIADSLEAGGFTGTVGFLVGNLDGAATEKDYPEVDFAATDVPRLPYTLAVQPGQTLVMRLDQYADSKILWPEDCSAVKLILVEAGPFGGEATIPAWPEDVAFEFHRYDTADGIPGAADTHKDLDEFYPGALFDPYEVFPNVNQGTVDLTWEEPVLSGKVAWLDMEFNGNSKNTGWFSLGDEDQNGMLRGAAGSLGAGSEGELIPDSAEAYDTTHNPQSKGINIDYKPYIAPASFSLPEEQWSLVTRIMMPEYSNMSVLTIGANYDDTTGDSGATYETDGYSVLALAVGALKGDRRNNDTEGDELILWYIPKNSTEEMVKLATATVPCITESQHLVSILFDRGLVEVWLNGNRLIRTQLPAGAKIGPGLQVGSLMGGANLDGDLKDTILGIETKGTNPSDPGTVDFIRVYNGLLSESALNALVCDYPYIHKEAGNSDVIRDIRYVRELNGGEILWVDDSKPWRREYKGDSGWWYRSREGVVTEEDDYVEPAEGAIIVLNCTRDTTIYVNTKKGGVFPSADRTYAQLIVEGGARVTIRPYDDESTETLDWETATDEDGNYLYGRLYFSGGAGEAVALHARDEATDHNQSGSGSAAACFVHDAILYASVCDLSRDAVRLFHTESLFDEHTARLQMFADEARMRGETRDVVECHLTGQVSGQGYLEITPDTSLNPAYEQVSTHVYVQNFIPATSEWLITDTTETNEHNSSFTSSGGSLNVGKGGLYARYAKYPGPLYLELNVDQLANGVGNLADQEWYSFGYNGDTAAETPSRIKPEKPKTEDAFEAASALYIRLKNGDTDDVLLVSANKEIANLTIDAPKGDEDGANESLRILPSSNGDRLTVTDSVTTARRLEVYDPEANGGAAGAGVDGIRLVPRTEIISDTTGGTTTVIETGTLLHGVESGVYAAGNTSVNYPLDGSSIARIESVNAIAFAAEQDLSATTLAAAEGATVTQTNAADAFHAGAMELAKGSRFTFASSEASVDGAVTLTGNATIEGTGTAARLTPVAGIAGQAGTETLTLAAAENASWKLLNNEVGGLPLTKTDAGTADIATDLPPNAGKVDVQEGTLAVATGIPGAGEAVGQGGLNVAEGATLAPTSVTVMTDAVAEIPAGQTVSGLGTIAGQLRLNKGARLDATEAFADGGALHALTVNTLTTDGATAVADIDVALPESTQPGLVFLRSNETALNWDARARLLAKADGTRWDVFLKYRPDQASAVGTNYLVDVAGLDVPIFPPDEEQPGEGENEWPDEDGDGSDTGDEMGEQIQEGGNAAGGAEGYTMAKTKRLTAADIAHVYDCFGSVWTYARRSNDKASEDYATIDLLMAYEFGISRMAFTQDGKFILVEATLRNALADFPYFDPTLLQGAGALKPTFLDGVSVVIVGPKGELKDVQEITAEQAATHGFTPIETATETARWFLVPYDEANFHTGEVTHLTVKAIPPAEQSAQQK